MSGHAGNSNDLQAVPAFLRDAHRRIGSLLYEDLFRHARASAIPVVTCEYDIVPPNEPSRSFHDKFGFVEQGTQWLAGGSKQVSLQAAEV
jgi:uncharacterized protein